MPFVYTKDGQQHQLDAGQIQEYAKAGKWWDYKPEQVPEINIVDREGRRSAIDFTPHAVKNALEAGYRFETAEEEQKAFLEQKYSGVGEQLKTALESAAAGATLGISDPILSGLGIVDPAARRARREVSPELALGAEIAGATIPALFTGGGTAAGQVAAGGVKAAATRLAGRGVREVLKRAPSAQVARASIGVERALVKKLGDTVKGRIASATLAQAGEGAVYGLGMAISEAAIQEKPLTAEQLMAYGGMGALLGGGVGGGIRGLGELTGAGLRKGKALLGKFRQAGPDGEPGLFARASGKITGRDPRRLQTWLGDTAEGRELRRVGTLDVPESRDVIAREMSESAAPVIDLSDDVFAHTKQLKPEHIREHVQAGMEDSIVKEYDSLIEGVLGEERGLSKMIGAGAGDYGDRANLKNLMELGRSRDRRIDAVLAKVDDPASIAGISTEIVSKDTAARVFNHVDNFKRDLGKKASKLADRKNITSADHATFEWYRRTYEEVRRFLEREELFGAMATKQKAINEVWTEFLEMQGYRMSSRLETRIGKHVAEGREFEYKYTADPGAHRKFIDRLGDVENDLDYEYWTRHMRNRARLARKHGEVYNLQASDMAKIEKIEQGTERWFAQLQKAEHTVGIQKELAAIGKAGISQGAVIGMGAAGYVLGGPVGAAAGAILPAFLDPAKLIHTRAILDRVGALHGITRSITGKIESGVNRFFDVIQPSRALRATTVPAAVKSFLPRADFKEGDPQSAFRSVRDDLQGMVTNPEVMQARLENRLEELNRTMPELATHLAITAAKAANYLLETAPKPLVPASVIDVVQEREPDVPEHMLAKWFRRLETVENPTTALEDLADGTLTREQVETLQAVYPGLYQSMMKQILKGIADGKPISYEKRIQLSYLMDQPLDSSMRPQFVQSMQMNFAAMAGQAAAAGAEKKKTKPRKMRAKASEALVDAHMTSTQRMQSEV